ncbi:NAD(P)/FAD-dependent oxidoreductase, partial [Candidatus Margulisiibacteriota bacterium]
TNATVRCKTLLIASGTRMKKLHVVGEKEFLRNGVDYGSNPDLDIYKGKEIVIIGSTQIAAQEALLVAPYAKKVTLVFRNDTLIVPTSVQNKIESVSNIDLIPTSEIEQIQGEDSVEKILVKNVSTNNIKNVPAEEIIISIGISPNTDYLDKSINLDEKRFVITSPTYMTNQDGVFAAGSIRSQGHRAIMPGFSDGFLAAQSITSYLESI